MSIVRRLGVLVPAFAVVDCAAMIPSLVLAVGIATTAQGLDFGVIEFLVDRDPDIGLWNGCQPVPFSVSLDDDATAAGISEPAIRNALESRLRAARLYDGRYVLTGLVVTVNVLERVQGGGAFTLALEFRRPMIPAEAALAMTRDPERLADLIEQAGLEGGGDAELSAAIMASVEAAAWRRSQFGTFGNDPAYVTSGLPELVDEFLTDYLRVNAEACEAQ